MMAFDGGSDDIAEWALDTLRLVGSVVTENERMRLEHGDFRRE